MDYVNGEAVDFDTDQNGQISSVKVGIIYEHFRLKYFQCLYVQGNMRAPASYPDASRALKGRREGCFPWSLAAHHQSLASLRKTKRVRRRLYAHYMISLNLRGEYFFFFFVS